MGHDREAGSLKITTAQRERLLIRTLDAGKHIVADILHGVEYDRDTLQRWISEAEGLALQTPPAPIVYTCQFCGHSAECGMWPKGGIYCPQCRRESGE
jgi:hypothetical protein